MQPSEGKPWLPGDLIIFSHFMTSRLIWCGKLEKAKTSHQRGNAVCCCYNCRNSLWLYENEVIYLFFIFLFRFDIFFWENSVMFSTEVSRSTSEDTGLPCLNYFSPSQRMTSISKKSDMRVCMLIKDIYTCASLILTINLILNEN